MLEETSSHRDKLNATGRTKMILKACVTIPSKGVAYLNTLFSEYCVSSITRPRPKARFWAGFFPSVSQIGAFETLIGRKSAI